MPAPADPYLIRLLERATADALEHGARTSERFWETIREVVAAIPADELLAVAVTFCGSEAPAMRATGAGVIGELCNPGREIIGEALGVLGPLLAREQTSDVIGVALHGVALTNLPEGVALALPFVAHPAASVRLDATHALYWCAGEPPSRTAIDALVALSRDPDEDVRDWATFGLGSHLRAADGAVLDALAARLDDPHRDTHEEAVIGLARRGDARAREPVASLLEEDEVSTLTVEAAGHLADARYLRPLLELGEWWEDESDVLRLAIARCDPAARARFDDRVSTLVELIRLDLAASLPGAVVEQVQTRRRFDELTTDLELRFRDVSGNPREGFAVVEDLFAHPDVADDPERAAARFLEQLAV